MLSVHFFNSVFGCIYDIFKLKTIYINKNYILFFFLNQFHSEFFEINFKYLNISCYNIHAKIFFSTKS